MRHPLCSVICYIYSVWPLPHMELLFQLTWPVTHSISLPSTCWSCLNMLHPRLSRHDAEYLLSSVDVEPYIIFIINYKEPCVTCITWGGKLAVFLVAGSLTVERTSSLWESAGMKTLLPRLEFIGKWWEEAVRIINKRIKLIIFAGSNLFLSSSFLHCCVLREASCYSSSWTRVSAACCVTFNTL